jgi:hypothetical protein
MRIAPEVQPKGITKETIEDNPSSEFRDAVEKISIEFKDVLERVHYVDLIALVIQKQNELCQEDFDIEQFYEELYDFY